MKNTKIMCAVMLDTKVRRPPCEYFISEMGFLYSFDSQALMSQGPEIRTGFLKDAKPIQLTTGKEVTITTDYETKGDESTIAMR